MVMPTDITTRWIAFSIFHECIAMGIALELSEAGIALFLSRTFYPKNREPILEKVKVAVLYLCCDDVDILSLRISTVDRF